MILILDNYDSFTFNLKDYCEQVGADVAVHRNDEISVGEIKAMSPEGIIISPGPKVPGESGITMDVVEAFWESTPILGVCLGHQAIGLYAGAKLEHAQYPMHGKISEVLFRDHPMFQGIEQPMQVCRYHSLIISDLPRDYTALGYADDGALMAFAHNQLPIWGVQFHPEAILTRSGLQLIRNWYQLVKRRSAVEKGRTIQVLPETE
ncbi:MAG: aminodeoxychorismate/anthranilate synthase component II [Flavobacteriales bacterium]|nr:aminodeoxychorismate/anthranilate synthase component II [Flavobacteriales bacterium]